MNHFNYGIDDCILCEIPGCTNRANDLHHIERRGMGGSKLKDNIENIMALCRSHHEQFGDKKQYLEYLQDVHNKRINGV